MAIESFRGKSVKISIMVEGDTERAFFVPLRNMLKSRLPGRMPKLDAAPYDGRIPTGSKLRTDVRNLLNGPEPADAVIALTDVYTGTREFVDAADARTKMLAWVGDEPRFYPHAAQFDFEAWLLPYWNVIQRLADHNKAASSGDPEKVNHNRPPSARIKEVFQAGKCRNHYNKVRDGNRILKGADLLIAANACSELRSFLNTILTLCDGPTVPDPPR